MSYTFISGFPVLRFVGFILRLPCLAEKLILIYVTNGIRMQLCLVFVAFAPL